MTSNFQKQLEDIFTDLESTEETSSASEEEILNNIPNMSSLNLCHMVIMDKIFNFNRNFHIHALQELEKRKFNGDPFDYQLHIKEQSSLLPKTQNVSDLYKNFSKIKVNV